MCALLNSFFVDYEIRKLVTKHVDAHFMYTLRIPRLRINDPIFQRIIQSAARLICTTPQYDDLARSVGLSGHIDGVIDTRSRNKLRAEINGQVAHLYRLSEEEFTHVLATFICRKSDAEKVALEESKVAALQAYRALRPPEGDPELVRLATLGESSTLEYKSSLRVPTNGDGTTKENSDKLEAVIVKVVASFLNAQGGTLLIGLDDDGKALGLEADYASFKAEKDRSRDGFERFLTKLLDNTLGEAKSASIDVTFGWLNNCQICRVDVPKGPDETYVDVVEKTERRKIFYLRRGNRSEELKSGPELSKYNKGHWPTG